MTHHQACKSSDVSAVYLCSQCGDKWDAESDFDTLRAENERLTRQLSECDDSVGRVRVLEEENEQLRQELATARKDALEDAASVCEKLQDEKDAPYDGKWKTLGTVEISGSAFSNAIRALAKKE